VVERARDGVSEVKSLVPKGYAEEEKLQDLGLFWTLVTRIAHKSWVSRNGSLTAATGHKQTLGRMPPEQECKIS
jgi:hypothetical protein